MLPSNLLFNSNGSELNHIRGYLLYVCESVLQGDGLYNVSSCQLCSPSSQRRANLWRGRHALLPSRPPGGWRWVGWVCSFDFSLLHSTEGSADMSFWEAVMELIAAQSNYNLLCLSWGKALRVCMFICPSDSPPYSTHHRFIMLTTGL